MKLTSSIKSIAFNYNFARDGGAIGSINMGVFLPANCIVLGTFIQTIQATPLLSAGAAVVNINTSSGATILDNATSGLTGTLDDYNNATYGFNVQGGAAIGKVPSIIGVNPNGGLVGIFTLPTQVVVDISAFALTDGAFNAAILYIEISN